MVLVNGIFHFLVFVDDSVINQSFKHILACQIGQKKSPPLSFILSFYFNFLFFPIWIMFGIYSE